MLALLVGGLIVTGHTHPLWGVFCAVASPVQRGVAAAELRLDAFRDALENNAALTRENEALRVENDRLRYALRESDALERENERLRMLLGLRERLPELTLTPATVTARVSFDALTLRTEGAAATDDCVVTADGALLGVVTEAGNGWAAARAVTYPGLALGGVVLRTDALCLVEGDGRGALRATCFPKEGLLPGDRIVTAGSSGRYPAGLMIGTVTAILPDEAGFSPSAAVAPAAMPGDAAHVYVVRREVAE